jgi:hypothetical protein
MKRETILIILLLISFGVYGQSEKDYLLLRQDKGIIKQDTIWGDIILPENGVILNVKITTSNGLEKFKIKETYEFRADGKYFARVPYNTGFVIAQRLVAGAIDLYLYDTRIRNYEYSGGVIGEAMASTMIGMTSFYYIKRDKIDDFIKVPHSKNNIIDKLAYIFEGNEEIYNKIKSGDFEPEQIPSLVEKFNAEF